MYLFLFFILSLFLPTTSFAQTATPTIDPKTEAVREMTEKKVQDMLGVSTSSVSTITPKSLIGTITQIGDKIITINYKNNNQKITFTTDTIFINEKKIKIKINSLKPGQIILAMGYYDQYSNFDAKRIIVTISDAIENKNEIVFGTIADISQTSNVLVLIPIKNKNTQYQITTDSKTKVVDKDSNTLNLNKLTKGQKVVVIIQPNLKISNTFNVFKIITLSSVSDSPIPTPQK